MCKSFQRFHFSITIYLNVIPRHAWGGICSLLLHSNTYAIPSKSLYMTYGLVVSFFFFFFFWPSSFNQSMIVQRTGGEENTYTFITWSQGTRDRRSEKQHLWTIIINSTSLPYSTSFKQLTSVNLNTNSGRFSSLKSLIFHPKHPPMYCEDESGPPAPSPTAQPSCLRRQPPLVGTLHQILR